VTRKEAVKDFLEKVRMAYIEDQKAKGILASGKSAAAFRIDTTAALGRLYGSHYLHFQRQGRGPGGFPPIESIIEWIKIKRIQADIPEKALAFLIARKIAKAGTDIFLRKRPALSVEGKMDELRKELVKNIIASEKDVLIKKLLTKLGLKRA
jgi:hypothetical protein